jgi:nucleoid-associated protein YgaU
LTPTRQRKQNRTDQSSCPRYGVFFGLFKEVCCFCYFNHSLEFTMTKSVLFAALLAAVALTACGKKEEAAAPAAPATEAAAPAAAPAADAAAAPAAPAADAAAAPAAPAADAAAPAKQ